jgi:hypothetical protein
LAGHCSVVASEIRQPGRKIKKCWAIRYQIGVDSALLTGVVPRALGIPVVYRRENQGFLLTVRLAPP